MADRVVAALVEADDPLSRADLREHPHIKNETLVRALAELQTEERIARDRGGWHLVAVDDDEETDGTTANGTTAN